MSQSGPHTNSSSSSNVANTLDVHEHPHDAAKAAVLVLFVLIGSWSSDY
jgi:hypothetical protein